MNFIDDTTTARRVRLPHQTTDATTVGGRPGRIERASARPTHARSPLLPAVAGYGAPELIAHGTTALVFRATQARLNRQVAIKVLTVDNESVWANAEKELAITVTLSGHPHIVSIIDTGLTEDHRPYIVMEYCEGGSYAQILREDGPVPVADVIDVGIRIGEALHAAHQVGIIHRDVKPANILRSRFGAALTDFGIARASDELNATLTREMMTPNYASPEALRHEAQSGLSDVYSLAATMWTLLVGGSPFANKSNKDLHRFVDRVLHEPVPRMPRKDVPPWLSRELTRAMSKVPSERHASALEFSEALRRGALSVGPTAATAPRARPRTGVHRRVLPRLMATNTRRMPQGVRPPQRRVRLRKRLAITAMPLAIVLVGLIAYQASEWHHTTRAGQAPEPTRASSLQLPSITSPSTGPNATASPSPVVSPASPTPVGVAQAPAPVASEPASPPSGALDGTGEILGLDGQCLDNNTSKTNDGNTIQVWPCNFTAAEMWTVANDRFSVQGKCMAVQGTADGTNVVLWTCDGSPGQIWQANPADHTVRNPASGLCLTTLGIRTPVIIATCSDADGQKWTRR